MTNTKDNLTTGGGSTDYIAKDYLRNISSIVESCVVQVNDQWRLNFTNPPPGFNLDRTYSSKQEAIEAATQAAFQMLKSQTRAA